MTRLPRLALLAVAALLAAPPSYADPAAEPDLTPLVLAQRTCGDARSCRDAVILWCNGYRRADGDNDGIPCERVCRSRAQVNEIRAQIGC
ncbi:hypothetical protein [Salinarimonas sp.]|uniref:hypothetical protein n=1 Tax=Salinarimonas sp. TaxID=2766526 RepID=UPI0032D919E1